MPVLPGVKIFWAAALLACAGCSSFAAALAPDVNTEAAALREGAYVLDRDHAALIFKVDHLGFSKFVGRFDRFDVSLDFDPDNPEAARVEAIIEMASLNVAVDGFARTLLGSNWFDAEAHPRAIFRSTGVTITGDNEGVLNGDLTLRGVTQPVSMAVTFNGGGNDRLRGAYVTGFSGTMVIDRNAFGVDRFGGLVGDEVVLEIEAEFKRR